MSQPAPVSSHAQVQLPADDIIVLRDATWADYQRLLEIRGDRPVEPCLLADEKHPG